MKIHSQRQNQDISLTLDPVTFVQSNMVKLDKFVKQPIDCPDWAQKTEAKALMLASIIEPRHEKTCLQSLCPGKSQTSLLSYRD